ncbi:MAG: DUF4276 family protein [Bryobacterales bacterium]|nr:DUF4276 family protein [Bryobacteraceae bacterium]MDW8353306.1 DUF4276 family protein [Bryobacterales bacterium]
MPVTIAAIVEGHGEVTALPALLHRVARVVAPRVRLDVPPPIRIPRQKLIRRENELERAVELAGRIVGGRGGILVLLDADDDCPAQLGPALLERAQRVRGDTPIAVVVAKREFEAWFLAAADSLRERGLLKSDAPQPTDPESVRGAKEWLGRHLIGECYSEAVDQLRLAREFDVDAARRCDSFDKFWREAARLLGAVADP